MYIIRLKELLCDIEQKLTHANVGSYVAYDCGEDYFDDAENINEVKKYIEYFCNELKRKEISFEGLYLKIYNITVEWCTGHSEYENYTSFKEDFELLGESINLDREYLRKYIVKMNNNGNNKLYLEGMITKLDMSVINKDEFINDFLDFIESKNMLFGGDIK